MFQVCDGGFCFRSFFVTFLFFYFSFFFFFFFLLLFLVVDVLALWHSRQQSGVRRVV